MQMTNISFSDCARHLYISKLNTVNKVLPQGVRRWLYESDNYIITDSNSNYVEICYYDEKEMLSAWASDISRLSCASIESVANIENTGISSKFIAWNLVQYYYAAFYSAHSILKILGLGLVQIDSLIIDKMKRKASAVGGNIANSISRGMYCVRFDTNSKMTFYKISRYDDSHKGLWKRFYEALCVLTGEFVITGTVDNDCLRLKNVSDGIQNSLFGKVEQVDALDAQNRLEQLKNTINLRGDQNWLSYIRNLVNYNQELGVWYPYTNYSKNYNKSVASKQMIFENFLDEQFLISDKDDEVMRFIKTCQLINSMNIDLLSDLQRRNPESKSFLREYVFKYINLVNR